MKKIVVIEDETLLRELICSELEKAGYKVFSAAEGRAGLELVTQERPDMILLDLLMPEVDGYVVLEELRASEDKELAAIPVVVISNSGQLDDMEKAYTLGARSVLIKAEFNPDELVIKVGEMLKEK